jgi:hypothetical protein
MVPGNDRAGLSQAEDLFGRALQSVMQSYSDADLQMVEDLMTIEQTFVLYLTARRWRRSRATAASCGCSFRSSASRVGAM